MSAEPPDVRRPPRADAAPPGPAPEDTAHDDAPDVERDLRRMTVLLARRRARGRPRRARPRDH